jgi:hypothetical protein
VRAGLGRPVIMPAAYIKTVTYDSYLRDTTLEKSSEIFLNDRAE